MGLLDQFKEKADLQKEESIYKPQYEVKKNTLRKTEIAKIENSFNSFFKEHGFTVTKNRSEWTASYNGQNIVLDLDLSNEQFIVLHGKIKIDKDEFSISTFVVDPKPSSPAKTNVNLSEKDKELATLSTNVEYYKSFDPEAYKFRYLLVSKPPVRHFANSKSAWEKSK